MKKTKEAYFRDHMRLMSFYSSGGKKKTTKNINVLQTEAKKKTKKTDFLFSTVCQRWEPGPILKTSETVDWRNELDSSEMVNWHNELDSSETVHWHNVLDDSETVDWRNVLDSTQTAA